MLFGSFLLVSLYLQNVLGAGALQTGLAFLPLALAIAAGVHGASHIVTQHGVRTPMAVAFTVVAVVWFQFAWNAFDSVTVKEPPSST